MFIADIIISIEYKRIRGYQYGKIRIAVNHLCNDMIIGEDVYNKSGVVLVAQGSIVTDEVISLLSRHLIDSVAIEYQAAADEPQQAENAQPLVDENSIRNFRSISVLRKICFLII